MRRLTSESLRNVTMQVTRYSRQDIDHHDWRSLKRESRHKPHHRPVHDEITLFYPRCEIRMCEKLLYRYCEGAVEGRVEPEELLLFAKSYAVDEQSAVSSVEREECFDRVVIGSWRQIWVDAG